MENLAGDLLFGLKFVKLSILPTLFIHFVWHRSGELRSRYLRINQTVISCCCFGKFGSVRSNGVLELKRLLFGFLVNGTNSLSHGLP